MKNSGLSAIGIIPSDWQITRGKSVLKLLSRPIKGNDGVITCFRDGEVTLRSNRRTDGFTISFKEIGYQGIEPGDLVVHGMDGFAGAIGISDSRGKASPVLNVLDSSQDKRYLMYYLRALAYREVYLSLADGIRVRSCNLSWKKIGNLPILVPPLAEQHRIADYLDVKCADIDEAIQSAENSISDYKSYLQARLYQMVTKGLDPAVALEKTSLEWIESAPTHWELAPHKRMMRKIKRLCDHWAGEPVLSLTTNGVIVRDIASGKGKFPATFDGYQYISAGNLVLCLFDVDVTPRCVGLAKQGGVISPAYSQFEMLDGAYAPYYDYYLRAMDDRKLYVHLTSTLRHSFTEDTFGMIPALRPPFEEQVRIAAYLDDFCSNVDRLINAKQSIIDDLKAYKQSLIYETVTGKREV
jgi:type I restriction enzyme S subunit